MPGLIGGSPPFLEPMSSEPWPEKIAKTVGVRYVPDKKPGQGHEKWTTRKRLTVGGSAVAGVILLTKCFGGSSGSNQTEATTTTEGSAVAISGSVLTAPTEATIVVPVAPAEKVIAPPVNPTVSETTTTILVSPTTTVFIPAPTIPSPETTLPPVTETTIAPPPPDTVAAVPPLQPVFVTEGLQCFEEHWLKELNGGQGASSSLDSFTKMERKFSGVTDLETIPGRVHVGGPVFAALVDAAVNLNGDGGLQVGQDAKLITGCISG